MRILHVYKDYYPVLGGIENHLYVVAREQAKRGHDVTVLVTNPAGRKTTVRDEEGVTVIRAARISTVASTPLSFALFRQLRRQKPDVVHLHFPYPVGEVSQWLLKRGRSTVLTYHSDVIKQTGILRLYNPVLKRILQSTDCIIATSAPYIQSSPYLRPLADRCKVIPLGIDINRFARPQPHNVAILHARYPGPLLLFVGRLRYYKGLNYLIEAMKEIDATLLVVGTGPEAANLGEQAYLAGVAHKVRFLGDISDESLPSYFQAADLFVLPSSQRSEAFGIVLLETMAAGTPPISTELATGTSWVNQHEKTGLVVPPGKPAALSQAINSLLADDNRRQQLGMNAQHRAKTEFGLPLLTDRLLALYQDVLDG
jgi:rhamnosyl/mannosyltransferase